MNSKVIKFDKAPEICNSNHQTVSINMISLSNRVTPICLTRNYVFGSLVRFLLTGAKFT